MRIEPASLDHAARIVLGATLDAALEDDIVDGRAQLWCVDGASYAVTRVERMPRELVLCAYAGRDVLEFFRALYAQAQAQGIPSIRWHTRRPGLARMGRAEFDIELAEYVYRARVISDMECAA